MQIRLQVPSASIGDAHGIDFDCSVLLAILFVDLPAPLTLPIEQPHEELKMLEDPSKIMQQPTEHLTKR